MCAAVQFATLQASDRYIQANPQTLERVVRAVSKTQ
jgi:ABC-type nitrate/sulfonate/bicarbonate transport system substrate-binding protein